MSVRGALVTSRESGANRESLGRSLALGLFPGDDAPAHRVDFDFGDLWQVAFRDLDYPDQFSLYLVEFRRRHVRAGKTFQRDMLRFVFGDLGIPDAITRTCLQERKRDNQR